MLSFSFGAFSFGVTGEGLNVIGVTGKLAVSLCYY